MVIDPKEVKQNGDVIVTLTYGAGDAPFTGTEDVLFSSMNVTAEGATPEEKAAIRDDFRQDIKTRVANHLKSKYETLPVVKTPSNTIATVFSSWTLTVGNVLAFMRNNGTE